MAALSFAVALAGASPVRAGPAYSIGNTSAAGLTNAPFTLGFTFEATTDSFVSALGLFDSGQDGLAESHAVGLYDSAGMLLAAAVVARGTADPLTEQFRYASIAGADLAAGHTYTVGALYADALDGVVFPGGATGFRTAPGIAFRHASFAFGSTLAFPSAANGALPAYFGPNLIVSVAEPRTIAMLATALAALAGCLVRSRRGRRPRPG